MEMGLSFVPSEENTQEQNNQFNFVIQYFNYSGLNTGQLHNLEVSPVEFTVHASANKNDFGFDYKMQTAQDPLSIWWCPNGGLELPDGQISSPAVGLWHELGHATEYLFNRSEF